MVTKRKPPKKTRRAAAPAQAPKPEAAQQAAASAAPKPAKPASPAEAGSMVLPWQTSNADEVGKPSNAETPAPKDDRGASAEPSAVESAAGKRSAADADTSVGDDASKKDAPAAKSSVPAQTEAEERADDAENAPANPSEKPADEEAPADGKAPAVGKASAPDDETAGESPDDEDASDQPADTGGKRPSVADAKRVGSQPASEDADEVRARARKRSAARFKAGLRTHWKLTVVGAILLVIVAVIVVFSWDRWLRYDDAADFQGAWLSNGTASVVAIDGQNIQLAPDVAYEYTIDATAKTISFSFADLRGQGRYRFSADRQQLVITDGAGYTWLSTLGEDVQSDFDGLVRMVKQEPAVEPTPGNGVTVLNRA